MEWIKRLLGIQNGSRKSKDHVVSDKTSNREKAGRESLLVRFGKLYQPSVLLVSGSSGGFSRLGGLPQLSPEIEWPEWNNKPQAFLAQIDLGELNQALPSFLPNKGRLYFFYDQEQGVWGFDPKDVAGWRVLYDRATEVTFTERAAPAGLPGDCIYKPKWITPQKINLLPDSQRIPRLEFDWDRDGDS